ncbi:MAG: hypothetical protein EAY69_05600, partial [Cytophagales bacterium]
TYTDYYAFGMEMVGRNWSEGEAYRQGYNGKENDKDFGEGVQDYGMRVSDTQTCRFFSVDPLTQDYPWYTPYQFAGNKCIMYVDIDGLEEGTNVPINLLRIPLPTIAPPAMRLGVGGNGQRGTATQFQRTAAVTYKVFVNISLPPLSEYQYNNASTLKETGVYQPYSSYEDYLKQYNSLLKEGQRKQILDELNEKDDDVNKFVRIYKAPPKGKGQLWLVEGFKQEDFPTDPPYKNGTAYFAAPNDRSIAQEYAQVYGEGILEIIIPKNVYEKDYQKYERKYPDGTDKRFELLIPQKEVETLNKFTRELKFY